MNFNHGLLPSDADLLHRTGADALDPVGESIYRDNSLITELQVESELRSRRASTRREATFPVKLHQLLSDPDAFGIIFWLPHGRAWRVLKYDDFENILLPRYFVNNKNISSFMRQVNGWNFRRITKGADEQAYYHELFLRGMPHLCRLMTRTKIPRKKRGSLFSRKLLSRVPDFYRMHAERPLPDIHGNGGAANDAKDPKREAAKMVASSSANNVSNFYGHLSNFNEADDPILPLSAMSSGAQHTLPTMSSAPLPHAHGMGLASGMNLKLAGVTTPLELLHLQNQLQLHKHQQHLIQRKAHAQLNGTDPDLWNQLNLLRMGNLLGMSPVPQPLPSHGSGYGAFNPALMSHFPGAAPPTGAFPGYPGPAPMLPPHMSPSALTAAANAGSADARALLMTQSNSPNQLQREHGQEP